MPASTPFSSFSRNNYSENGEDGILSEIIQRLAVAGTKINNWCVEFGAWDGKLSSNTFSLVEHGWNAIYIEGDPNRYQSLKATAAEYPSIIPINSYVSPITDSDRSLDSLLSSTNLPLDFDILSIDIDSFDLHVWESTTRYTPKIVVIEVNSSFPPGTMYRYGDGSITGSSFSSTLIVGLRKGYELVCHTGNMIFVRRDLISFLGFDSRYFENPDLLFNNSWLWFTPSFLFKKFVTLKRKLLALFK